MAGSIAQLVQDCLGLQSEVQTKAPQLASTWGWLAAQGKAIVAGQGAKISADTWVSQYRAFLQNLTGVDTSTGFLDQVQAEGWQGAVNNLAASVAQLPATVGTAVQNAATFTASTAGGAAGAGVNAFLAQVSGYLPWIAGAIVLAIALPSIVRAIEE